MSTSLLMQSRRQVLKGCQGLQSPREWAQQLMLDYLSIAQAPNAPRDFRRPSMPQNSKWSQQKEGRLQ
jgi:hypothetical protein